MGLEGNKHKAKAFFQDILIIDPNLPLMVPGLTGLHGALVIQTVEIPETELVTTQLQYLVDLIVLEIQEKKAQIFAMEISVVQVHLEV